MRYVSDVNYSGNLLYPLRFFDGSVQLLEACSTTLADLSVSCGHQFLGSVLPRCQRRSWSLVDFLQARELLLCPR